MTRTSPLATALGLALCAALPAADSASPNLTWDLAKRRAAVVSDVSYKLRLELRKNRGTYEGDVTAFFRLSKVPPKLHLDFMGETISKLEINGVETPAPALVGGKLWLPTKDLKAGKNRVRVAYENDFDTDGSGLHKIADPADGNEYVYTDFEPYDANRLFPCFDQPDLKATYRLTVLAPADWEVVANGREYARVADGDLVRHEFRRTLPFSTYIFAVCAGPFAVWEDLQARIPSRVYCVQSMAAHMDSLRIFEVTRQGFDFFEKYFDVPYPFEKYDQIFLPQFNAGAMENVACVTFNGRYIYRHEPTDGELNRRANTILHEMAHMWFGDIVTMEWWNDLWLNESFATYMANLGLVKATRFKDSWRLFTKGTKTWAYWQDQLPTTHPIETPVPDTQTTFTNFDGITYGKGASVLKQLAFYVGEDAFRRGVSAYLKKFRWKNTRRKDFMNSIAAAAGRDLDRWTDLWLKKSGVNTLTPEFSVGKDGRVKKFYLRQGAGNGDAVLRPHRLKVAFFSRDKKGALARTKVVTVEVKGARTRVKDLERWPAPDFVLVNDEDHAYAKTFLDPASLAFAKAHLEDFPGDVRAQVWNIVHAMVRDGAAAPAEYLDLFLAKAPLETDTSLLRTFRWPLSESLDGYLPPATRAEYRRRFYAVSRAQAEAGPAGSDRQKTWFDMMVGSAEHREALDALAAMLKGEAGSFGVDLDPERRWAMVGQLVRHGHPDAAALRDARAKEDPGERSQKTLVGLAAAAPTKAAKAAAWKRILEDEKTPLDHLKAAMREFFSPTQTAFTGDYAARYFETLPGLLKTRDDMFVRSFAQAMFPMSHVSQATLDRSEALLAAGEDYPYFLRRVLLEKNDELARRIRLRAK